MKNASKKKREPSRYHAVVRKRWQTQGSYTYEVVILLVQRTKRQEHVLSTLKHYDLGVVTKQEACEARRNLLSVFRLERENGSAL
jgi:hypothetical protein